jgi:hypothetical protein
MKKRTAIVTAGTLAALFLLSPLLFRKYTVPLLSNGTEKAYATRPFALPGNDNEISVYVGATKVFGLWSDVWDAPLFIYPFTGNKRFLCIFDDDTSVLVFVVDLNTSAASVGASPPWPTDDYLRKYITRRMTKVVIEPKGTVRLPTYAELSEVTRNLSELKPAQLKATSFPQADFGFYRTYWPKEALLSEIESNRKSPWP